MGLRRSFDGGYWLTLPNKAAEAKLNAEYTRMGTRWYPDVKHLAPVSSLGGLYVGLTMQVIGKGPSLDRLAESDLDITCPIICLNQSIKKLDSFRPDLATYMLQSDPGITEESLPQQAKILLNIVAKGWYKDYPNRIIFDPETDFGTRNSQLSASYAMYFARLMGCVGVRMMCFDACMTGDFGYAQVVGPIKRYANERHAGERFLKHRAMLDGVAKKLGLKQTWFMPK